MRRSLRPAAAPLLGLALASIAAAASAQLVHRGAGPTARVTQSIAYEDAWEDGGRGPSGDGTRDVISRREVDEPSVTTRSVQLLLFGPWGHHLYSYDEERIARGMPDGEHARTLRRAWDLDGDGAKEIVFLERVLRTRHELDDMGLPAAESGPYFAEAAVSLRYLAREQGSLVEHELEAEAGSPAMKELLQAELGGPVNAWLQLAAADVDFARERYEQARYRWGVVREWAEAQLTGREIRDLSPQLPIPSATPDDPQALWLAATRRIGTLPRWYQRR